MLLLELLSQERAVLASDLVEAKFAGDLYVLQVVAAVRVEVVLALVLLDALSFEPRLGFRLELLYPLFELRGWRLLGNLQIGLGELVLDVRREETQSAHHPRRRRNDDGVGLYETSQSVSMQGSRPAEGHEAELSGVVAPLDAHHPQCGV